jgi:hypothetical protein
LGRGPHLRSNAGASKANGFQACVQTEVAPHNNQKHKSPSRLVDGTNRTTSNVRSSVASHFRGVNFCLFLICATARIPHTISVQRQRPLRRKSPSTNCSAVTPASAQMKWAGWRNVQRHKLMPMTAVAHPHQTGFSNPVYRLWDGQFEQSGRTSAPVANHRKRRSVDHQRKRCCIS